MKRALRDGVDADLLGEFLATVDWGTVDNSDPVVREMLGQLEAWTTAYSEGQLSRDEYTAELCGVSSGSWAGATPVTEGTRSKGLAV